MNCEYCKLGMKEVWWGWTCPTDGCPNNSIDYDEAVEDEWDEADDWYEMQQDRRSEK